MDGNIKINSITFVSDFSEESLTFNYRLLYNLPADIYLTSCAAYRAQKFLNKMEKERGEVHYLLGK